MYPRKFNLNITLKGLIKLFENIICLFFVMLVTDSAGLLK